MSKKEYIRLQVQMTGETNKAILVKYWNEDLDIDVEFWFPKSQIEEDEFDRETVLKELRDDDNEECVCVHFKKWLLKNEDWWDDSLKDE